MAGRRIAVLFAGVEFRSKELVDLPFAVEQTESLASALRLCEYDCQVRVNLTSSEIDKEVRRIIRDSDSDDLVVVHVLAHGRYDIARSLAVTGSDGERSQADVGNWIKYAGEPDRGRVLFLIDLAGFGRIAEVGQLVAPNREAWLMCALADPPAFHGTFTSAAAEVLERISSGEFGIATDTSHVPLSTIATAIRMEMQVRDGSGVSPLPIFVTTTTDAAFEVDASFFLNPRYARPDSSSSEHAEPEPRGPLHGERALSVSVVDSDDLVGFAVGVTTGIALCDTEGAPVDRKVVPSVYAVAAIPGRNALLCGSSDGSVSIRSISGLAVQTELDAHGAQVNAVAVAAVGDGLLCATASDDTTVRVWELSPSARLLFVLTPGTGFANTLAFAGPLLACGTSDGVLVAWDVHSGDEVWRTPPATPIHGVASGIVNGLPVLVCVYDYGTVVMWDQETGAFVKDLPGSGGPLHAVALAGDGRTAVVGGDNGRIDVVDLVAGTVVRSVDLGAGAIWSLALRESAQGLQVVVAADSGVRVAPLSITAQPATPVPRGYAGFAVDAPSGDDQLGIETEVNTLCDLVLAKEITPPLSIGLFGDWGTGKSFFMGRMRDRVNALAAQSQTAGLEGQESALCARVCQIEFNAWHYIDADLWASLATTIFEQLAAADESTVSHQALKDLPSVKRLREDLTQRQGQIRDLLTETDQKLLQETAVRVRDALTTDKIRAVASEAANHVDDVMVKAGVPKEKVSEVDLREMAGTTGTLWQNLSFVFRRTNWIARLLTALAVLLFVAGPPMLILLLGDRFGVLATTISSYVVFGFGAAAIGKPFLDRAARAIGAAKDLVTGVDDRRRAPVQARKDTLRQRLVEVDAEILDLDNQIRELRRGNSISAFAVERAQADHYRRHEGMVATLRRDLEEMSSRLTATKAENRAADLERIVLYIDDLDRCPPRRVVQVLQAIHLLLAFPLFVVVVGVDSRWLLRSLDMFLRESDGDGDEADPHTTSTPQNYLEKIFQISLCLRPMSPTGYADLISANIGQLEPDPQPQSAAAPVAPPKGIEAFRPPMIESDGDPAPSIAGLGPLPPPVAARELRSYDGKDRILHLRFSPTALVLESVDATGFLTRHALVGTDPRDDAVRLVDSTLTSAHSVAGENLLVIGESGAMLVDSRTGKRREIRASNQLVTVAKTSPTSDRVILGAGKSDYSWYAKKLTAEPEAGDALARDIAPLAISDGWLVERCEGSPVVTARHQTNGTTVTVEAAGMPQAEIDPSESWVMVHDDKNGLRLLSLTDPGNAPVSIVVKPAVAEFGPDGTIAAAHDGKVSVWDCATGKLRAEFPVKDKITAIAFSADGRRLATGSEDGQVRTWVIHDEQPAVDLTASALRLTTAEHAMVVAVRPFVETPRSAKRLINTYRLLRAGLTDDDLVSLRSGGHQPVLLLLSVLLGEPEPGTELLQELLSERALPPTLTALIRRRTPTRREGRTAPRRVAGRGSTKVLQKLEAKVAGIIKATGTTDDSAEYRRWAGIVARYSFRTLDL